MSHFNSKQAKEKPVASKRNMMRLLVLAAAIAAMLILPAGVARAATLTWDANGAGDGQTDGGGVWLDANQWWNGAANQAWVSGSDAVFGLGGAGGAVTLASPTTVNSLTFNPFSGTYTLGTAGQAITLTAGLTMNSGAGNVAIVSPVTLGGAQSWTNNSTSTLTVGTGAVVNGANLLTIGGSGNTALSGVLGNGAGGLTKSGAGTLTLTGANTYTGLTSVTAGVLNVQNATALGATTTGTSVTTGAALQIQGGITVGAEALTLNGTGIAGDGALRNISGTNTYGGLVTLGSATRINSDAGTLILSNAGTITGATFGLTVGGAGNTTINSIIGTTTGSLTKEGSGTLTLSGANTFTGGLNLNAGSLVATVAGGFGTSGNTLVFGGGNLELRAGATTYTGKLNMTTAGAPITINPAATGNGVTHIISGAATLGSQTMALSAGSLTTNNTAYGLTLGGATTLSGNPAFTVNNNGTGVGTLTLSGVITGSGYGITKDGAGTLTISGNNTAFTGGSLTVNAGRLSGTTSLNAFGAASNTINLGATSGTDDVILNYGLTGSWPATPISVRAGSSGTRTIQSSADTPVVTGTIALASNLTLALASNSITFSGGITGAGNVNITGIAAKTLTIQTGALGYAGNLTNSFSGAGAGAVTISAPVNISGSIANNSAGTGAMTLSGVIGASVTGVTQNSATSTLTLSGANSSYARGVNILSGKVSGTNANAFGMFAGTITIGDTTGSAGATLSGGVNGTIANPILVAGGNTGVATITSSANTPTFSGTVTLDSHDLYLSPAGNHVTLSGSMAGTGNLVLNSTAAGVVTLSNANINPGGLITNVGTGTAVNVISGVIATSVTGLVQNSATSVLNLTGANTYAGEVTVSAGALRANDGTGLNVSSLLTLNGGVFETGTNLQRAGGSGAGQMRIIGGPGGFSAYGAAVQAAFGTLASPTALTWGTAPFQPTTFVLNASTANNTIDFKNAIDLGASNRAIQVGANVATMSGILSSNGGGITKIGAGTLVLPATNTYTGPTTVGAGTLVPVTPASLPGYDSAGKVVFDGGTVQVPVGGSGWTTAQVDTLLANATKTSGALGLDTTNGDLTQWTSFNGLGALGLTKVGANTLTLDQANTFTGPTTVSAGTLRLANTNAIASSSGLTLASGTLQLRSDTATTFNTPTATLPSGATATIDVNNNGSGSGNTLALGGSLSTTASWTLNVTGGNGYALSILTATFSHATAVGNRTLIPTTASVSLGTVSLLLNSTLGDPTLILDGTSAGNSIDSMTVSRPSGANRYNITKQNTSTWTINNFNGGGAVGNQFLLSAGTLIVTGSLNVAGMGNGLVMNGGTLHYNSPGAVSSDLGSRFRFNNASLKLDNTSGAAITTSTYNPLMAWNANWTFIGSNGANSDLYLGTGAVTLGASPTVTIQNAATTLSVGGAISGAFGLTKDGPGTLALSGANAYTGATTVNAGTLVISASPTGSGAMTVNAGTLVISGSPTGNSAMTVNAGGALKLDYSANDGSKIHDSAVLTLGGGTVELAGDGVGDPVEAVASTTLAPGASSVTRTSGTAKLAMGFITPGASAMVNLGAANIATTTNTNDATGILGLWATVGGDWAANDGIGNIVAYSGYTDVTRRDGGTQVIADGSAVHVRIVEGDGSPAYITLGAATTTINTLNQSAVGGTGAATIDPAGRTLGTNAVLVGAGAGELTIGTGTDNGSLTAATAGGNLALINNTANTLTVNSVIADNTAASTLSMVGNVTLNGNNTYAGVTYFSGGTLVIGDGNALGDTAAGTTVSGGGTLALQGGITVAAEALTLSGTGVSGGGALRNVSGNNTYSGPITLAGAAKINSDAGTLTLDVASGDAVTGALNLTLGGAGDITVPDPIATGTGTVTKEGTGTLLLAGANTSTGNTAVNAGTLQLDGSLAAGGTLAVGTDGKLTGSGIANGNATITGDGVIDLASTGRIVGTLGVTGGNWNGLGSVGNKIAVTSGAFTVANGATLNVGDTIADEGRSFDVTGTSTATIAGTLNVDPNSRVIVLDNGTLRVTGTVNTSGRWVAVASNSPGTARVILEGSGKWTHTNAVYNAPFVVGESGTCRGELIIRDSAQLNAPFVRVATWGPTTWGVVIQDGGTATFAPTAQEYLDWQEPAIGLGANGQAEYHLNGGVLNSGVIGVSWSTATGQGRFYFNGGKLIPNTDDFVPDSTVALLVGQSSYMQNLNQVVVQAGGAIIDTDGHKITIAQNLEHDPNAGAPAVDGGLTKLGAGTLILKGPGASTYTGPTAVNVGTLVARNATALGAGGAANVSVASGAGLRYNAAADSPLAIGGTLTVNGGAGTTIGASIGATPTSAAINVAGDATITNGAHVVNIHAFPGIAHATGLVTLVHGDGAGSSLNPATAPTLGVVYNNTDFTVGAFVRSATDLKVNIISVTPLTGAYWTGGLAGNTNVWAVSDGTTASNWVTAAAGGATALVPGPATDVVISANSNSIVTAPTATVLGADMTINSLTISDTANGLGLSGDDFVLTIAPASAAAGITMSAGVPASNIAAHLALGAA
jgi:autotransporter-associated beta strand protein